MDDFLNAVKTVHSASETTPQPILTAVTTKQSKTQQLEHCSIISRPPPREAQRHHNDAQDASSTAEDALRLLRSKPATGSILATLRKLSLTTDSYAGFSLTVPGPLQSQIITTLLDSTLPNFWPALQSDMDRNTLVACLLNISGLGALVSSIRTRASRMGGKLDVQRLKSLLEALDLLLQHSGKTAVPAGRLGSATPHTGSDGRHYFVLDLWTSLDKAVRESRIKRDLAWKEAINLLASGKIISTVAQAEAALQAADAPSKKSWLGDGKKYAEWLGRNTALLARPISVAEVKFIGNAGELLSKALSLGYLNALFTGLFSGLVADKAAVKAVVDALAVHARRRFIEFVLRWLSDLSPAEPDDFRRDDTGLELKVSALASLLQTLTHTRLAIQHLTSIINDPVLAASISLPVLRACIAVLSQIDTSSETLQSLLESLMTTFSDRLFTSHAPLLQQEAIAQALLLTAGYLHRQMPMALLMIARSSSHLQGTSNRLDASGQRARWLGMVVATAISRLVDKEGSRMEFGTDEMESEEARWYMSLTQVRDKIGELNDFATLLKQSQAEHKQTRSAKRQLLSQPAHPVTLNGKPVFGPPRPPQVQPAQTEVIGEKVTELLDEVSDEEDDDLKPYAKPDSDPEDSDEDATLVNRNKPRPPVYLRDLMAMLRDDKDHDRFQLGIAHAAALLRRKANFGSEVRDHAIELISLLSNLQDPFETEAFDEMRLQAVIAVLLTDINTLGPWLSRQVFAEGYSIAQRCLMLSALGLGGRELAGLKEADELNPAIAGTEFASKKLPPRLHSIYAQTASTTERLEGASRSVEEKMMQPLALKAADQSTKHLNAVKVRTFSSRLSETERTKRKPAPNQLTKVFGPAMFFPLVGRYQQEITAYGSSSVFASASIVLITLLKTLALLLHASGPATLGLQDITAAFWDLLLGLRVKAASDISILSAVLFSLLTHLEVNTIADAGAKRLAQEEPKRLMETQSWVEVVFEQAGGGELSSGGGEEEGKVRALAAGVLVKCREVVEAYQKEVFGRVIG